jgi:hypothetical protein
MYEHQDVPFMRVRTELFPDFPTVGPAVAAALPIEFQYFRTAPARRSPGTAMLDAGVDADRGHEPSLFFRGQLHPLGLTLLDDGRALRGGFSYKLDFYDDRTIDRLAAGLDAVLATVAADPGCRLSGLGAALAAPGDAAL